MTTIRKIELFRAGWGLAGLVAAPTMLRVMGGSPQDKKSRVVMRILGARQLAQAGLSGIAPTPAVLAMGVWVDAAHAATAAALAEDATYRKPALADMAVAGVWACFGWVDVGRSGADHGEKRRSTLARDVLRVVPGGRTLLARASSARA